MPNKNKPIREIPIISFMRDVISSHFKRTNCPYCGGEIWNSQSVCSKASCQKILPTASDWKDPIC